jgi:phosphomethylpyrimidine synthase
MSIARKNLDWDAQMELVIDPQKAKRLRKENPPGEDDVCTMCGKYCAIKQVKEYFQNP